MRAALLLLVALPGLAGAQSTGSLFTHTRPDVAIVVRHVGSGNDVVDVTMQNPDYPPDLLRKQAEAVAKEMGADPTGLQVFPYRVGSERSQQFVRANFGVPNLVDRQTGALRVEPFAKAFAGAPSPFDVDVLMIQFEQARPTLDTIRSYASKDGGVELEGVSMPGGFGVEYRVKLNTQDPAKIHIPDTRRTVLPDKSAVKSPAARTDWTLYGVIAVAALAVGALVYSLLLQTRPGRTRPPRL